MRALVSLLAILFVAASSSAQSPGGAPTGRATIERATANHRLVRFVGAPDSPAALDAVSRALGLSEGHDWRAHRAHTDRRGARHERFRQAYRGVPVLGGEYVVHHYPSGRTSATGHAGAFEDLDARPTLSEGEALVRLRQNRLRDARHVVTERTEGRRRIRTDSLLPLRPNGEVGEEAPAERADAAEVTRLVIVDRAYPRRTGDYRLAYEVVVGTPAARDRRAY